MVIDFYYITITKQCDEIYVLVLENDESCVDILNIANKNG